MSVLKNLISRAENFLCMSYLFLPVFYWKNKRYRCRLRFIQFRHWGISKWWEHYETGSVFSCKFIFILFVAMLEES